MNATQNSQAVNDTPVLIGYHVVDNKSNTVVREYKATQRTTASRYADRMDNKYGGYRYFVRPIWSR